MYGLGTIKGKSFDAGLIEEMVFPLRTFRQALLGDRPLYMMVVGPLGKRTSHTLDWPALRILSIDIN